LLSRLEFGGCYVYSPRGTSPSSVASRVFRDRLKRGDRADIGQYAARVREYHLAGEFGNFFGDDVTLVPIPGSAPLLSGALWLPQRICEALHAAGLARDISPILDRVKAVKKSAFQSGSERPTRQEHFDSMTVDVFAPPMRRALLVDDVITSGCTMLAAAERVSEMFERVPIRGFAMARAMSGEEVDGIRQPCRGEVRPSRNGRAYRRP
jgi:predicted amidophosphoribosyltransferase